MVNRDDLIAYLLHQMPEAERTAFAEEWFADPELYGRLHVEEATLLDSYVRGELSRGQRERVEQYLLDSDYQRRKLAFAAALRASLPPPARSSAQTKTRWALLIAASLAIALTGASLWLAARSRNLAVEVARLQHQVQPVAGDVFSAFLTADGLRGSVAENALSIPQRATLLRLELELSPGEEKDTYSATISSGGRVVWTEGPLHAEPRGKAFVLIVWAPATLLVQGNYTIKLEAGGTPAAFYTFIVAR